MQRRNQAESTVVSLADRRPGPGYESDGPVEALTPGELLPLSSLRLWAAPYRDPQGSHVDWREGLMLADLDHEAIGDFGAFMGIVLTAAERALDVRCAKCARLSPDEATFLQCIGQLQRQRPLAATLLLGRWMPHAAVRIGLRHLGGFARAAADAGLWIPSIRLETRRDETACVDPGLARIH
ncbi:hypothetical protein EDC65_0412 [Stella humosa]|uniref:Uncharacterized protein n=1 Tax=Stella humosa TaxID=94 RepID=A0A3N1M145_9PROT|nr:hypothetical protein [Stella humosa]ROQ01234.1 hypothetical protein EDC65_0412 [Stella humosa]BBK31608.1 hypothetical protein STHU_22420 [Stella humosa]